MLLQAGVSSSSRHILLHWVQEEEVEQGEKFLMQDAWHLAMCISLDRSVSIFLYSLLVWLRQ